MKLTVIAATGGIGRHVAEQAIARGHQVTAVARNLVELPREVRSVQVDLARPDQDRLASAMQRSDAVLSCLGRRARSDAGITSSGTRAIVEAMKTAQARRIVAISASPVSTIPSPGRPAPPRYDPGEGFLVRHLLNPIVKTILRDVYADLALMEDVLFESGLDWTTVRPPRLTDGPCTGAYRTALGQNVRGGLSISRADVAHFMLATLSDPRTVKQAVGIG